MEPRTYITLQMVIAVGSMVGTPSTLSVLIRRMNPSLARRFWGTGYRRQHEPEFVYMLGAYRM
jgi:hypothetical protein